MQPQLLLKHLFSRLYLVLFSGWTLLCVSLAFYIGWDLQKTKIEIARREAIISINKDLAYRSWVSDMGGVYVSTSKVQPNPYLTMVQSREIRGQDGRELTLVNPAYMTRMVHERETAKYGTKAHLTSLRPLRPENAADTWEVRSLRAFEQGKPERSEVVSADGKTFLRYMVPFLVTESCMKCHAGQGYKVGEIRGGLSVSIPFDSALFVSESGRVYGPYLALGSAWFFVGLGLMLLVYRHTSETRQKERELLSLIEEKESALSAVSIAEARLRSIIHTTQAGYFRTDQALYLQDVNQAWLTMHGYARLEEVRGKPVVTFVAPQARELAQSCINQLMTGQPVVLDSNHHLRRDGAIGLHTAAVSPLMQGGRMVGLEGFLIDLSSLQEARARNEQVLDEMVEGFALHEVIFNSQGKACDYRFLKINKAFESILGMKAEMVVGRTATELFPSLDQFLIDSLGRVQLTGNPESFEYLYKHKECAYFLHTFRPQEGMVACNFYDVTEGYLARQRLLRDEAELYALYEEAPVMLALVDEKLHLRRVNKALLQFAALPEEFLLQQGPGAAIGCRQVGTEGMVCGRGAGCGQCLIHQCLLRSIREKCSIGKTETTMQVLREGREEARSLTFSIARLQLEGDVLMLLCMDDVSEQRKNQARMAQQAELLDIAHDAICLVDHEQRIVYWNRSSEELFAWPHGEALGQAHSMVVSSSSSAAYQAGWAATLEAGHWVGDLSLVARNGKQLTASFRMSRVLSGSPDEQAKVMIISTDVTESRKLQSQVLRMQRMENLGALSVGVAHDLNNILVPIMMSVDLLAPVVEKSELANIIQLLRTSAQRGADIVRQLLLFGRGTEMHRCESHPELLAGEMSHLIRETFPKDIHYAFMTSPDLPTIDADPTQMHQVLLNLCVNARDSMPNGGELRLDVTEVSLQPEAAALIPNATPGNYVCFSVSDTGAGMPPEIIEKIFDPFFTTKPVGKGTGLGLSTVMGIVQSHDGFLTVDSKPGQGSCFKVFIHARAQQDAGESLRKAERSTMGAGETILVIDDEASIRSLVGMALKQHNFRMIEADDGAIGLALFADKNNHIDAVICDMMMPHLNGRRTIDCIRQIRPTVPILAMSGISKERLSTNPSLPEDVVFLQKPFDLGELLNALAKSLKKS